jgi:Raf kinase inhibitor-like YbhB/YbcL family protein
MATAEKIEALRISSTVFNHNDFIPSKYTCDGENINPPIEIKNIPLGTKSLVLIIEDPDAPKVFDHWLMWNIAPQQLIKENSAPGIQGRNSKGENKYMGPCPPSKTHRYFFKVFALDSNLNLTPDASRNALELLMEKHILAKGEVIGLYKREKNN